MVLNTSEISNFLPSCVGMETSQPAKAPLKMAPGKQTPPLSHGKMPLCPLVEVFVPVQIFPMSRHTGMFAGAKWLQARDWSLFSKADVPCPCLDVAFLPVLSCIMLA